MNRYPAYKPSGVDWLGEIPVHWDVWKLSHAFKKIGSGTTPNTNVMDYYDGEIPWVTTSELRENLINDTTKKVTEKALKDHSALFVYPKGTLLIAMYGATVGRLGILGLPASMNQACCALAESKTIDTYFLYYWLLARRNEIIALSSGGGQPNISQEKIRSLKVSTPPIEEQQAIVAFLDGQTAVLDALIAEKQALIGLLQEKRAAVIGTAVTQGLDPTVPMKESGVEWIGRIPAHWEVLKIKHLFRLSTEKAPENNDFELLSLYTDIGVRPRAELEPKGNKASTTDGYWLVKEGDIIVNKLLAWMGAVGYSAYEGVTSPAYDILRKTRSLNSQYYHHLFRCGLYLPEFRRRSRGIMDMRLRLYFNELGQIPVPYPPNEEQNEVIEKLSALTAQLDELIAETEASIATLQEYRVALIASAVTGQIDVRGYGA